MNNYKITTATINNCAHKNIRHYTVHFWIFWNNIFICKDCGEAFTSKELKEKK